MSLLRDFTAPYSRVESFVYDRVIAPAVLDFHAAVLARLAPELPPGGRLVEVGCGGGQLLATLARERPDARLVGVDLSAEQTARASERTRAHRDRVECLRGSALALPIADGSADLVLSVASIKHWSDPGQGLREAVRVLRGGGLLAVIEAERGAADVDVRRFVERWRIPRTLAPLGARFFARLVAGRSFDLAEAEALLAPLGLEDAKVERLAGLPAWLMSGRKPG